MWKEFSKMPENFKTPLDVDDEINSPKNQGSLLLKNIK